MMELLAALLATGCLVSSTLAVARPQREDARASTPTAALGAPLTVSGRLNVRRLDGEVEPLEEGTLKLEVVVPTESVHPHDPDRVIKGTSGRGLEVPVEDGSFAFEVPAGTHPIRVLKLDAPEMRVLLRPSSTEFDPEAQDLTLDAVEVEATLLDVYAWETEEVIEDSIEVVQLVRSRPRWYGDRSRLGKKSLRLRGQAPLELWPTDLEHLEYQIRAPGFAWTSLTLDPSGGRRGMLLEPAGNLEVRAVDRKPWSLVLRLRRSDGKLHSEGSIGERWFRDIPAGIWNLSAEGPRLENPRVYGSATVDVVEGETTTVSLVLSEIPRVNLVPVAGTLVIPEEWELSPSELLFEGIDKVGATPQRSLAPADLEPVAGRPDAFHFDAGGFDPGRYRVRRTESPLMTFFEVPLAPEGDVLLEMPPPTWVSISFVDAEDRSPVEPRALIWNLEAPLEWRGGSSGGMYPIPRIAEGCFEGPVASGRVSLTCWGAPRYRNWSRIVDLSAEGLTLRVKLVRRTGLVLQLKQPEGKSTVHRDLRVEAVESPEGGRIREVWSIRQEITYEATLPGTYLLRFTPPEGYAALPDREIVIESERLTSVEVVLVPRSDQ